MIHRCRCAVVFTLQRGKGGPGGPRRGLRSSASRWPAGGTSRRKGSGTCREGGWPPGLTVPAVMLGIFLVGVLGVSILQSLLVRHKVQRREAEELQCRFLLYSGLELAAARLARDPGYTGERWNTEETPLAGEVLIDILDRPGETPEDTWVRVTASYPSDPVYHTELTQEYLIRRTTLVGGSTSKP